MANRYLKQFRYSPDTNMTTIDGYSTISDSVGTVGTTSAGLVSSVARAGVGKYTITLQDSWATFKSAQFTPICPTSDSIAYYSAITSYNVSGSTSTNSVVGVSTAGSVTAKTITVQFYKNNAAAELPANSGFSFQINLKNSGLPVGE